MTSSAVAVRSSQASFPAFQGLSPTLRIPLSNGDRGTAETIARIRKLVYQGMTDQVVNRTAIAILQAAGVPQFDGLGEIRAIYEWARQNIRFTRDIAGVETLRTAREILTVRAGDCDDINGILLPALLATIGHDVRLVTIASVPSEPKTFSHIYCEVLFSGRWIPLDAARVDPAFGKGPRSFYRKRIWSMTDSSYQDVRGLGMYMERPRRRLGSFSDIADSIAKLIGAGTSGAANIIAAQNRSLLPPGFPAGGGSFVQNPSTGQLQQVGPNGQLIAGSVPGGVFASGSGTIPNWMIYGFFGLGAVFLLQGLEGKR